MAAQWLAYGQAEAALAAKLILAGLEKAARTHALAAESCTRSAPQAGEIYGSEVGVVSGLEKYRLKAAPIIAYNEELLTR